MLSIDLQNYRIRYFQRDDLTAFAEYRADANVARFQSWESYSLKEAIELFENMDYAKFGEIDSWWQLAIADIHTDNILGDLAVHFIDPHQVEIGFTISPAYQNRGVAFEAVSALLDYLFTTMQKHRVIAVTDTRNEASVKLLEKCGFRKEGHFLKNILFKGEWGDEYLYARLKAEHC